MISTRKVIRIVVRKFWGACAFLLISLAVFVVIGRELSPKLNRYKDDLSQLLSERLAIDVRIEAMQVDWSGLSPQLSLQGVELVNPQGQTLLTMQDALVKVNLLRSLLNRNIALDQLQADTVAMQLNQNEQGVWGFRGVPWKTTASDNFDIDDPLDVFLLIRQVDLENVQFQLFFRDGDQNQLNFPNLSFANNGDFHRLNSSIVVDERQEAVSLIVEFRGDPRALNNFSAKGYTRFNDVNIDKVLTALPGTWQQQENLWQDSVANVEAWFDIFAGGESLFRGRLDVVGPSNNRVGQETGVVLPQKIGGNFTGRLTPQNLLSISLRDTVLNWQDFSAPALDLEITANLKDSSASPTLQFRCENLAIDNWLAVLQHSGVIRGKAETALASLQPHGQLQNVKLLIIPDNNTTQIDLSANFDQLSVDSWRGTPKVTNLKGYTRISGPSKDLLKGEVQIDTQQAVSLQFPTLYDKPMDFDVLNGQVNWQVNLAETRIHINSGLIQAKSADGDARGYFDLAVPLNVPPGQEELILQLGMTNTPIKSYDKYIPSRLPRDLLNWMADSLGSNGVIASSGMIYRGGLTPEGRQLAEFQLYADVKNSNLRYHPDWPELRNATGKLWMDRLAVHGDIESGQLLQGKIERLTFDVTGSDINERLLTINANLSSDASDGLHVLRGDALLPVINHQLDSWQAEGKLAVDLAMAIPLRNNQNEGQLPIQQSIAVHLDKVDLHMANIRTDIFNLEGTINFDSERSLHAKNLRAQFLEQAISIDIHDEKELEQLHIAVTGNNNVSALAQWSNLQLPSFIEGSAEFLADIFIGKENAKVLINSDLAGVQLDLPTPFGKSAEQTRAFQLQIPLGRDNTYPEFSYANNLFGVFHINGGGLRRAVISTDPQPQLPAGNQFLLSGRLAQLDFDTWRASYQKHFNKQAAGSAVALPLAIELQVAEFSWGDFVIANMDLSANSTRKQTQVVVASEKIAGNITLFENLNQPIILDLAHIKLPKVERKPPTWADVFFPPTKPGDALAKINPNDIPAFDFAAKDVFLGEELLGTWSFNARPLPSGLAVTNLRAKFIEGEVGGLQAEEGARLNWLNKGEGTETRIEGRFHSNDLASLLAKWDQPQLLQSENATFDFSLRWPNAPTAIATNNLQGEVVVDMSEGSFYRSADQAASSAILQLVSILNFDTWVRRLRLDFSDLGRRGLAYDKVEGLLRFDSGQVYLDKPLLMQTQSGEFQFTGLVDLENNQLDTKLTMTLPMGGNFTFLTALAAGLPAAAGVWVVSKIFDEQFDKVSTLSYAIDGPLDNPNSRFLRLFDDKAEVPSTAKN